MLCKTCPKRSECKTPCEDLEKDLRRVTNGQIEFPGVYEDTDELSYESLFHMAVEYDEHLVDALYSALCLLDPADRRLLYQHFWLGYSKIQIAAQFGLNRNTVHNHFMEIYKNLRRIVTHEHKRLKRRIVHNEHIGQILTIMRGDRDFPAAI